MSFSDSSFYETTYSEDERIEAALRKDREKRNRIEEETVIRRCSYFEEYQPQKLQGLDYITQRQDKIKFRFVPSEVTAFVNRRTKFYVSFKYKIQHWWIKRESLPVNCKEKVRLLFLNEDFDDHTIFNVITRIHYILLQWCKEQEQFRKNKFLKYKAGDENIVLDSDDEEFFLDVSERTELINKRIKTLKKMRRPTPSRIH